LYNYTFQNLSIRIKKKNIELNSTIKIDSKGNYFFIIRFFKEKQELNPLLIDVNIIKDLTKDYLYNLTKLNKENSNRSRHTLKDQFLRIIHFIRGDNLHYTKNLLKLRIATINGFNLQIYAISSCYTNHDLSTLISSTLLEHISSALLNFHAYNVYFVILSRSNMIKILFDRIKVIVKVLRILLVIIPGIIQSIIEYNTNVFSKDLNLFFVITSFTIGFTIILPISIPKIV
jgi:hypothetical protein